MKVCNLDKPCTHEKPFSTTEPCGRFKDEVKTPHLMTLHVEDIRLMQPQISYLVGLLGAEGSLPGLLSCLDVPRVLALGLSSCSVLGCLSDNALTLSETCSIVSLSPVNIPNVDTTERFDG